jgi:dihydrofolate reductase
MHTTLVAAQSLDGFITRHDTPGTAFTSAADKAHFSEMLATFDCSILGGETYRVARDFIRKRLTLNRRRIVLTRSPARWVSDAVLGALEFSAESPIILGQRLTAAGCQRCALLGGAQIHHLYLEAGLVDEVLLTIEPRLFGRGTPLIPQQIDITLTLVSVAPLGDSDSLLVRYRVNR